MKKIKNFVSLFAAVTMAVCVNISVAAEAVGELEITNISGYSC